jgi:hypothetical protein
MFDKNYYQGLKQKVQQEFQKAQQKYLSMCEMLGKEYVSFQERVIELNEKLRDIEEKEKAEESKKEEKVKK